VEAFEDEVCVVVGVRTFWDDVMAYAPRATRTTTKTTAAIRALLEPTLFK
jgi:hypothetical protein